MASFLLAGSGSENRWAQWSGLDTVEGGDCVRSTSGAWAGITAGAGGKSGAGMYSGTWCCGAESVFGDPRIMDTGAAGRA